MKKEELNRLKNTAYNEGFKLGYDQGIGDIIEKLKLAVEKRIKYLKDRQIEKGFEWMDSNVAEAGFLRRFLEKIK